MALTHPNPVRQAIADLVVDRLDAGSTAGRIRMRTATGTNLAALTLSRPAFGNASAAGVATAAAITAGNVTAQGTIAAARFEDSNGVEVFSCAVGLSGSDINLTGVNAEVGDTVAINGLTYTACP